MCSARTINGIICGIRRHLEETVGSEALNPLDASDKGWEDMVFIMFNARYYFHRRPQLLYRSMFF